MNTHKLLKDIYVRSLGTFYAGTECKVLWHDEKKYHVLFDNGASFFIENSYIENLLPYYIY